MSMSLHAISMAGKGYLTVAGVIVILLGEVMGSVFGLMDLRETLLTIGQSVGGAGVVRKGLAGK